MKTPRIILIDLREQIAALPKLEVRFGEAATIPTCLVRYKVLAVIDEAIQQLQEE